MIKLFQPYISDAARVNVQRVLSSTQIAEGPEVKLFEREFAARFGFEPWQIVTLNSGTSALELAYDLAGIDQYSIVVTPVLTCTATNIPLVRRKAHMIFADVDGRRHMNLDAEDMEYKMENLENWPQKAIVFVHFGGSSEGMAAIEDIAARHDADLICDAAQALGNELSRRARFSCVSLQAIKSLTAGDGGILICRDKADADKARKLRWYGYDRELKQALGDTDLELAGYKMHMNDIAAAIGRGNLSEWDKIFEHRRRINEIYYNAWKDRDVAVETVLIPGIWNPIVIHLKHTFEDMKKKCAAAGFDIGQYHYPNSKYSLFRNVHAITPNMDALKDSYFMLPCHMGMSEKDAKLIAKTLW